MVKNTNPKAARQLQTNSQTKRLPMSVKDTDIAMLYLRANLNHLHQHHPKVDELIAIFYHQLEQLEDVLHHEEDGFTIGEMLVHLGGLEGVVRIQKALCSIIGMLMTYPDLLEDAHAQMIELSHVRASLREKEAR